MPGNGATRVSFQPILIETLTGASPSIIARFGSDSAGSADCGLTDGGHGRVIFRGTCSLRRHHGNDTLSGGAGAELRFGFNGGDGTAQSNTVNRGSGFSVNHSVRGGAGNDLLDGGADTRVSRVRRAPGGNIERLTLSGSAAINGTGNTLASVVAGNAAANMINGAAGNDSLTGGADEFRFSTALSASANVDRITDFAAVSDPISPDEAIFSATGPPGALGAAALRSGTAAAASTATRRPGGSTATPTATTPALRSCFATVGTGLVLTAADFVVV